MSENKNVQYVYHSTQELLKFDMSIGFLMPHARLRKTLHMRGYDYDLTEFRTLF